MFAQWKVVVDIGDYLFSHTSTNFEAKRYEHNAGCISDKIFLKQLFHIELEFPIGSKIEK